MTLPHIAEEFFLVADPELHFSPSGVAVGSLRLKASRRKKDGDNWVDDKVLWITARVFKDLAEHVVESLEKGDLVVVLGQLVTESWESREGEKRSAMILMVDAIGPSLRFRTTPHGAKAKAEPQPEATYGDEPPF